MNILSTIVDVLATIKGGSIFDAKLVDTVSTTHAKSAIVTFVNGSAAMGFEEYTKTRGLEICGHRVKADLVEVWDFLPSAIEVLSSKGT